MATVFWDPDETVLTHYLEHGSTITGTYYTDFIRKVLAVASWSAVSSGQCTCSHFTHHLDIMNYFTTHHICQIWLQVTIICFLN